MSNQLYAVGDSINVNGVDLECTGVTYAENDLGERSDFVYSFRLKSEVKREYVVLENELEGGVEFPRGTVHEPGAVISLTDSEAASFAEGLIERKGE